jgi:phosphoribosyl 1,2-cyclic phosphodiesterase
MLDFGISVRKFKIRTAELGLEVNGLDAIFISHEHRDHVSGLEYLSRKVNTPVFATEGTWEGMAWLALENRVKVRAGDKVKIGGFEVQPFRVPHDAREPVGYLIEVEDRKIGICTDLGSVNHLVRERLKGSDLVILESNHDPQLLIAGKYPWPLKQRILGRDGHLSNQACAGLLAEIAHPGLCAAVLAHVSLDNNTPELAFGASRATLPEPAGLYVTHQKKAGPAIEI